MIYDDATLWDVIEIVGCALLGWAFGLAGIAAMVTLMASAGGTP